MNRHREERFVLREWFKALVHVATIFSFVGGLAALLTTNHGGWAVALAVVGTTIFSVWVNG